MGKYVDKVTPPIFDWGGKDVGTAVYSVRELVESKYNATLTMAENAMAKANERIEDLSNIISEYTPETIPDFAADIPSLTLTGATRPVPTADNLDLDFPTFDKLPPSMLAMPTIDTSGWTHLTIPEELTAEISCLEQSYDTTLFASLLARLLNDLQSGATGLDATVEQGIYDRAKARFDLEEDATDMAIYDGFSGLGWVLPPLALAGRLQTQDNARAMRLLDLNEKIAEDQATLAQKNSQFIIGVSREMEAVLRDFSSKTNDRRLDYSKAVALNAITKYSEQIKAYLGVEEANKTNLEAQVAHLNGVVEYNKGLITAFSEEAKAFTAVNEGKAARNKAITDIYESEIKGFDAEIRQDVANAQIMVENQKAMLERADQRLRGEIANVQNALQAYGTTSQIRERIAEATANMAMQAFASSIGSVNMSAGLDGNYSVSQSESTSHSESRSQSYSVDNNMNESHTYEHDPAS